MSEAQVSELAGSPLDLESVLGYAVNRYGYYPYGKPLGKDVVDKYFYGIFKHGRLIGFYNINEYEKWFWNTFPQFTFEGMSLNAAERFIGAPERSELIYGYDVREYKVGPFLRKPQRYYAVFENEILVNFYNLKSASHWYWETFWEIFNHPSTPSTIREKMRADYEASKEHLRLPLGARPGTLQFAIAGSAIQSEMRQSIFNRRFEKLPL